MTQTGFQENLLRYLVQASDGADYIEYLDSRVFDLSMHQILFDAIFTFFHDYRKIPSKDSLIHYIDQQLKEVKKSPKELKDLGTELQRVIERVYIMELAENDREYIKANIINYAQDKICKQYFLEYSNKKLTIPQLASKLTLLTQPLIGLNGRDIHGFLLQDSDLHVNDQMIAAPTFLRSLNKLTQERGFYCPQLIVFISGPKYFKTGLIIKLAVEYARDGYQVYYADGENGKYSIRNRGKMAIMECTSDDLKLPEVKLEYLKVAEKMHHLMGGDLFIDHYPSRTASVGDVRNRLYQLKEERNWMPDVVFWDSMDHFLPTNPFEQRRDNRFISQAVCRDIIAVNNELECFSISPAQVNRESVKRKRSFSAEDIGEDYGKVQYAHGVFAICADEVELENGIRRIEPVAQREGERNLGWNKCIIHIDEKCMKVEELDTKAYLNIKDVVDE